MYIVRRQQKYFASLNEEYGLSCMMKVTKYVGAKLKLKVILYFLSLVMKVPGS